MELPELNLQCVVISGLAVGSHFLLPRNAKTAAVLAVASRFTEGLHPGPSPGLSRPRRDRRWARLCGFAVIKLNYARPGRPPPPQHH